MSNIRARAMAIMADKLNVSIDEITNEKTFSDLGGDSLDSVELIMELEKDFDIAIPDAEMESIKNVGDALDMVSRKVAEKEKPVSSL